MVKNKLRPAEGNYRIDLFMKQPVQVAQNNTPEDDNASTQSSRDDIQQYQRHRFSANEDSSIENHSILPQLLREKSASLREDSLRPLAELSSFDSNTIFPSPPQPAQVLHSKNDILGNRIHTASPSDSEKPVAAKRAHTTPVRSEPRVFWDASPLQIDPSNPYLSFQLSDSETPQKYKNNGDISKSKKDGSSAMGDTKTVVITDNDRDLLRMNNPVKDLFSKFNSRVSPAYKSPLKNRLSQSPTRPGSAGINKRKGLSRHATSPAILRSHRTNDANTKQTNQEKLARIMSLAGRLDLSTGRYNNQDEEDYPPEKKRISERGVRFLSTGTSLVEKDDTVKKIEEQEVKNLDNMASDTDYMEIDEPLPRANFIPVTPISVKTAAKAKLLNEDALFSPSKPTEPTKNNIEEFNDNNNNNNDYKNDNSHTNETTNTTSNNCNANEDDDDGFSSWDDDDLSRVLSDMEQEMKDSVDSQMNSGTSTGSFVSLSTTTPLSSDAKPTSFVGTSTSAFKTSAPHSDSKQSTFSKSALVDAPGRTPSNSSTKGALASLSSNMAQANVNRTSPPISATSNRRTPAQSTQTPQTVSPELDDFFNDSDLDIDFSSSLEDGSPPKGRTNQRDGSETLVDPAAEKTQKQESPAAMLGLVEPGFKDFTKSKMQRARTFTEEPISLTTTIKNPMVHRYLVVSVSKETYKPSDGSKPLEEVLLTVVNSQSQELVIRVRENWLDCAPIARDVIHVIGNYFDCKEGNHISEVIIDNDNNLLVVQPDVLIPCTSVSENFFCQRKLVLKSRLRSTIETNIYMTYGSIIHEIFQSCLATNDFSPSFMKSKTEKVVQAFVEDLFICNVEPKDAIKYVLSKMPKIREWGQKFISHRPNPHSFVDEHRSRSRGRLLAVSNIVDVEEEIWSPTYGLQGKIDVTVETCLQDAVREWRFLSPLEIKTSKNTRVVGHRAQTTLYTLLMADRYGIDIKYGVLVYSETGETVRVPGFADEVRDLLIHRNSIARNQARRDVLPDLIDNAYMCRKCERLAACMTFKCVDENASLSSEQVAAMDDPGILSEYLEKVGHVKQGHVDFFKHWNGLLVKEEMEMSSHLKEIWTLTSSAREKIGRSFAGLRVQGPPQEVQVSDVVTRYTYVLERSDPAAGPFTLANSEISSGDPIVVSDENGHVHLTSGLFVSGTRNAITITVNRRLTDSLQKRKGFDEEYNQVFNSRLNARIRLSQRGTGGDDEVDNVPTMLFRVDKDEFRQALSVARNNLVELLLQKGDHSNLRSIVDLAPPRFSELSALPQSVAQKLAHFNPDQFEAIKKVLVAQDYALILGMPGTGKTTTIAALIEILVARGQTVLLASYTHSAVDTILRKIKDSGFGILRLGRPSLVNPDVRHLAIGPGGSGAASPQAIADIEQLYFKPPVVAATCLGTTHWLFKRRRFDYCIVDEASQVTLPTCLGPIRHADRFVLVGDHFQLSPLVKSTEAQAGGLDVSLFKRLNDSHPEAVVHLEHQYRMCEDIMAVSNKLIYGGRLKCGSEAIAKQRLTISNKTAIEAWRVPGLCTPETDWLAWVLNER